MTVKRFLAGTCAIMLIFNMLPLQLLAEDPENEEPDAPVAKRSVVITPESEHITVYLGGGADDRTARVPLAVEDPNGQIVRLEAQSDNLSFAAEVVGMTLAITALEAATAGDCAQITINAYSSDINQEGESQEPQLLAVATVTAQAVDLLGLAITPSDITFVAHSTGDELTQTAAIDLWDPTGRVAYLAADVLEGLSPQDEASGLFRAEVVETGNAYLLTITADPAIACGAKATVRITAYDSQEQTANALCHADLSIDVLPAAIVLASQTEGLFFREGHTGQSLVKEFNFTVFDPDEITENLEITAPVGYTTALSPAFEGAGEYTLTVTAPEDITASALAGPISITARDSQSLALHMLEIPITIWAEAQPPSVVAGTLPNPFYIDSPTAQIPLTITDLSSPACEIVSVEAVSSDQGVLTLSLDDEAGVYTLALTPGGAAGTASIIINATNSDGKTGTLAIDDFTVLPALVPPQWNAAELAQTTPEDTALLLDVSNLLTAGDIGYTVTLGGAATHGTASLAGTVLTFTPEPDYFSTPDQANTYGVIPLVLEYVKLGTSHSVSASLLVCITSEEDAPTAPPQQFSCLADTVFNLPIATLLDACSTIEAGDVAFVGYADLVHADGDTYAGSLTLADDSLVYTPNIRYSGTVTFQYTIRNGGEGCIKTATGTVTLLVSQGANHPPVANNLPTAIEWQENKGVYSFSFTVTDRDMINWDGAVQIESGNEVILPQAGITLTPQAPDLSKPDERGYTASLAFAPDTFTGRRYGQLELAITLTDDRQATETISIPVSIARVNDAPQIIAIGDGGIISTDGLASISGSGNSYTVTMNEDTVVTVPFILHDPDMPLNEDGTIDLSGYTVQIDSDDNGVIFSATSISAAPGVPGSQNDRSAYTITLKPLRNANTNQAEYLQAPVSVQLIISDEMGASSQTVTFSVTINQVNDPPVPKAHTYSIDKDIVTIFDVMDGASDPDSLRNVVLQVSPDALVTQAATQKNGSIRVVTNSETGRQLIEYTPALHYSGTDTFTYYLFDGQYCVGATVTVNIRYVDYPPKIIGLASLYTMEEDPAGHFTISFTVSDDTAVSGAAMHTVVGVLENGHLIEDISVAAIDSSQPEKRVLVITPKTNCNSFGGKLVKVRVIVSDGGQRTEQIFQLMIEPKNDKPVAKALTLNYTEGEAQKQIDALSVLAACSDVDTAEDDAIFLIGVTLEGIGTGTLTPDQAAVYPQGANAGDEGAFSYLPGFVYAPPNEYFDQPVHITYTIRDIAGETSSATLTLSPITKNDPPVFLPLPGSVNGVLEATTDEDETFSIIALFKDAETALENLIISLGSDNEDVINRVCLESVLLYGETNEGMDDFTCGAELKITPRANCFSLTPITITITVSDGSGSVSQTILLTVLPKPDKPITPDQAFSTRESTPLGVNLLEECSDVDPGDTLKLESVVFTGGIDFDGKALPGGNDNLPGVLSMHENGDIAFTPQTGFIGTLSFDYEVSDSYDGQDFDGRSIGQLVITVGKEGVGPSIIRLPPIIAYAGQDLSDGYLLQTKNVPPGTTYTISAEISGIAVDGSTIKIDGLGGPRQFTAQAADPAHRLVFKLKSGIIGQSIIRLTITSTLDGKATENIMSFTVTTHAENLPPRMKEIIDLGTVPERAGTGRNIIEIDAIALADIIDPENETISFGPFEGTGLDSGGGWDSSNDVIRVEKDDTGKYILRYVIRSDRSAWKVKGVEGDGLHEISIKYTVFDRGGVQAIVVDDNDTPVVRDGQPVREGIIRLKIQAQNHAPYTHGFYMLGQWNAEESAIVIPKETWYKRSNDVDGDTRILNAVRAAASNGDTTSITSVSFDADQNIIIIPAADGWLTVQYQAYSQFKDNSANSTDQSNWSNIYLYAPPKGSGAGDVPPRASGSDRSHNEDALPTSGEYHRAEITGNLFGAGSMEGNVDVGIELVSFDTNNPGSIKIADARVVKETTDGIHRYYVEYKLAPNGNSFMDAQGNNTDSHAHPRITYRIWNGEKNENTKYAEANLTVYIDPVNDLPVMACSTQQPFEVSYVQREGEQNTPKSTTGTLNGATGEISASIVMERGTKAQVSFYVSDPDYPTQAKCDKNITVSVSSSKTLIVASNLATVTAPTDGSGRWQVEFTGFLPGVTEVSIQAYDEEGGGSLEIAKINVTVEGSNRRPNSFHHYAVFNEDNQASVKVVYESGGEDDSDPDGDPVSIVLEQDQGDILNYGGLQAEGDKIIFTPHNNFCHTSTLGATSGALLKTDADRDAVLAQAASQWIEIRYHLEDAVEGTSKGISDVKSLYIHFNPVNDPPAFVGLQRRQEIKETDKTTIDKEQFVEFTIKDIDSTGFDESSFTCTPAANDPVIKSTQIHSVTANDDGSVTVKVLVVPHPYKSHHTAADTSPLTITATDQQNDTAQAVINVHVLEVNNPPQLKGANPEDPMDDPIYPQPIIVTLDGSTLETDEDVEITIDIIAYYLDPDGDEMSISSVSASVAGGNHGTAINKDNKVVFRPQSDADYYTADKSDYNQWGSFEYTITDKVTTITGKAYVLINPVNDAPRLKNMRYSVAEDESILIDNLFTDIYNDKAPVWDVDNSQAQLAIAKVGYGDSMGKTKQGGTVEIRQTSDNHDWHIFYTPKADYYGNDEFIYQVEDSQGAWAQATITIAISAEDDPPRANFQGSANWQSGQKVDIGKNPMPVWEMDENTSAQFLYIAWDPEGKGVSPTATPQALDPGRTNCQALKDLLPDKNIGYDAQGSNLVIVMSPNPNAFGSFILAVEISDGIKASTYEIPVRVLPVNTPPVFTPTAAQATAEDTLLSGKVTASDVETPSSQLVYTLDDSKPAPSRGTVTVNSDGSYTYTPTDDYFGPDAFWIKVTDLGAENKGSDYDISRADKEAPLSASVEVTVTITPENDRPVAPASLTADKTHYRGGQAIELAWPDGSDVFNETKPGDMVYRLAYTLDGSSQPTAIATLSAAKNGESHWNTAVSELATGLSVTAQYGGPSVGWSATVTGLTDGLNTDSLQVYVQAIDNGKSYWHTGDTAGGTAISPAQPPLASALAATGQLKVDSALPTADFTLNPSVATTQDVAIKVSPQPGNAPGASAIAKVEVLEDGSYVTLTNPTNGVYSYIVSSNGTYTFRITDAVGNTNVLTQQVSLIDRVSPGAEITYNGVSGSNMHAAPYIRLTFTDRLPGQADQATDIVSGLASSQYQLAAGTPEAPSNAAWVDCDAIADVIFPGKGTYTLFARTVDVAGNVSIQNLGAHTVNNAPPVISDSSTSQSITLYEHSVGSHATSGAISFPATDIDGDTIVYRIRQDDNYQLLAQHIDIAGPTGNTFTLSHKGGNTAGSITGPVTLTFEAYDGSAAATATLAVTLVRVNDTPSAPGSFDVAAGSKASHYRGGASIDITWSTASDEETPAGQLEYQLKYTLGSSTGTATALPSVTGQGAATITIPSSYNGELYLHIRTADSNTSDINPDGSTGAASSAWVLLGPLTIDSTAPLVTHTITPVGDAEALITLSPSESAGLWQSGIGGITAPSGATAQEGNPCQFKVSATGSYVFTVYDNVGNETSYTVNAQAPGNPQISYALTPVRAGSSIAVSWEHNTAGLTGCYYVLEVSPTPDVENSWQALIPASAKSSALSHTYLVPSDFPDTLTMAFRVRAWDDKGLYSPGWSTGGSIICDSTKPTISLSHGVTGFTNQDVIVSGVITDVTSRLVSVSPAGSNADVPSLSSPANRFETSYTFAQNGSLTVEATDLCGNTRSVTLDIDFIDKLPPTVALEATSRGGALPPEGATYPIDFALTFDDTGVSGINVRKYAVTGSDTAPAASAWRTTDSNTVNIQQSALGTYYVHLSVSDNAGNQTADVFGPYTIVNTVPAVQDIEVTVVEGQAAAFKLLGQDSDYGDSVAYFKIVSNQLPQDGLLEKAGETGDVKISVDGSYIFTHSGIDPVRNESFSYIAVDTRGAESQPATVTLVILPVNDPPQFLSDPSQTPVNMPWNTTISLSLPVADPDDIFPGLRVTFQSSNPAVLPISGIRLTMDGDVGDDYKGHALLRLTPLPGAYAEDEPVTITATIRDPAGATDTVTFDVYVIRGPLPPAAVNQYYFVLEGGSVSDSVRAVMGHLGTGLTYEFDLTEVEGPGKHPRVDQFGGDLTDGSFWLTVNDSAPSGPQDEPPITVPVVVRQACAGGEVLETPITLYFCREANTFEEIGTDQLMTLVPGMGQLTPDILQGATISSTNHDILSPDACTLSFDEDSNQLYMVYHHEEYRYGTVMVTIVLDGQTIEIPIIIHPANNTPEVSILAEAADAATLIMPARLASMRQMTQSQIEATVTAEVKIITGQALKGSVAADDLYDDQKPNDGSIYDQSYRCSLFEYTVWCSPANGVLALSADGSYVYVPDEDFIGTDSFSILIAEGEGYQQNHNPSSLGTGILDVSRVLDGDTQPTPLLARLATVTVEITEKPVHIDDSATTGQSLFDDAHYAYIIGYEDGTVRPEGRLSRAEAATVFFRLLKDEVRAENWTRQNSFYDVEPAMWYNNAVSVIGHMGIISGYPNGSFAPDASITRAELATIAARFARAQGKAAFRQAEYSDISGHWAEEDILFASAVGWLDGSGDGTFRPNDSITRAEFVALVNRMTGRAAEHIEDMLPEQMLTWPDNTSRCWYYLDVQEATNSHGYSTKQVLVPGRDYYYKVWNTMLPPPDWKKLESQWAEAGDYSSGGLWGQD